MNRLPRVGETVVLRRYPEPRYNGLTFKRIGTGSGDLIRCMVVGKPTNPVVGDYSNNYTMGEVLECTIETEYWDLVKTEGFKEWAKAHP